MLVITYGCICWLLLTLTALYAAMQPLFMVNFKIMWLKLSFKQDQNTTALNSTFWSKACDTAAYFEMHTSNLK